MAYRWQGFLGLLIVGMLLTGCPKKPLEPVLVKKLHPENPLAQLLDAFSSTQSVQARASIRVEIVRQGQRMSYPLNGLVLYQKPDRLRLVGLHPLGIGLFDAMYRDGQFFLLSPLEKKAYAGEILEFEEMIQKTELHIFTEKPEGAEVPTRVRIDVVKKNAIIDVRLKEVLVNGELPEGSFVWVVPEGVEVRSLDELVKKKSI